MTFVKTTGKLWLALAVLGMFFGMTAICFAESPVKPALEPSAPSPILPGRPDTQTPTADDLLGPEFRSLAAGIAFRPPVGGKEIRRAIGGDEIVQFVNDKDRWQLKASRLVLSKPAPLINDTEPGKDGIIHQGLVETLAQQLKVDSGGAEILRQDFVNVGAAPVGMIAARYSSGTETHLVQRAVVQSDESLYYLIDFTTLAPRTNAVEGDAQSKKFVDLFSKVVDSIHVLDQSQLVHDQKNRLFFTEALYLNITEPKMRAALVPERWLRLIRDGKDIGYSYVIEEVAPGLPHKGDVPAAHTGNITGIRIGVRSRTFPDPGVQVDAESWSWVAMDKKQEEWSNVLEMKNPSAKDKRQQHASSTESGVAVWRIKPVKDQMAQNTDNPGIRMANEYRLNVTTGNGEIITKDLPPFYLPKSIDHLLPRLLPLSEPKGFMFATYISDQKEVVRRYIDVDKAGEFTMAGQKIHAVPIRDRVGLEGSVTTHYISPEGEYLGSVNEDSKIALIPTDAATLQRMWKDVDLSRPRDVEPQVVRPPGTPQP